ncbi:MAG: imidazole glycerol phosphate synthase subunit HisH [Gammaproteobacteria bacterium]|nr:imidazole glycerol phosphate synthase subunit HisH [Gammaproteobacteria bacterium]
MPDTRVAIVDCGGANLASLSNALDRLGAVSVLTHDAAIIRNAQHVILPGVGAAADAMQKLASHRLIEVIANLSQPVLGICLGMQLLAEASAEDQSTCLGIVPAVAQRLPASLDMPVPNMGWCKVHQHQNHELFAEIDDGSYFYFVHSFVLAEGGYTLATADHAAPFTAVLARNNFFATQFHPERSAAAGARLLRNFLRIRR